MRVLADMNDTLRQLRSKIILPLMFWKRSAAPNNNATFTEEIRALEKNCETLSFLTTNLE